MYDVFYLINPMIILTIGTGEFITAKACQFRPFLHGAIAMWTGSLACTLAVILLLNKRGLNPKQLRLVYEQ
jgi:hypothetical protein